jgi:hypothetical protein
VPATRASGLRQRGRDRCTAPGFAPRRRGPRGGAPRARQVLELVGRWDDARGVGTTTRPRRVDR